MITRPFAATLLAAALLALTACAPGGRAGSFAGSWGETDPAPNITISEDGSVHGTDGCNRLTGKGSIEGDTFVFGDIAMTQMACPDDEDVIEPWPSEAKVDGDELVLLDESGAEVARLPRLEQREG